MTRARSLDSEAEILATLVRTTQGVKHMLRDQTAVFDQQQVSGSRHTRDVQPVGRLCGAFSPAATPIRASLGLRYALLL